MAINQVLARRCERLAETIIFAGVKDLSVELTKLDLEFRKDKTIEDVRNAVKKGVRAGAGKTEHEISMSELYLCSVLKLKASK